MNTQTGTATGETTGETTDETTGEPAARRYPLAPVVGVAIAVFRPTTERRESMQPASVQPASGEVLLVKRKYPPRAGEWGLPGGRLKLGEKAMAGAARELWEECGIAAEVGGIVDTFEPIVYDDEGQIEYHYVVIEYWGRFESGRARPGDDAAAVAWFPFAELGQLSLQPDTLAIIAAAHAAWQHAA